MLDDPTHEVRDAAFSVAPMRKGFLLRERKYAYIQYGEDASGGIELFDMVRDPKQFTNLAKNDKYRQVVQQFKQKMTEKLKDVRDNDLPASKAKKGRKKGQSSNAGTSDRDKKRRLPDTTMKMSLAVPMETGKRTAVGPAFLDDRSRIFVESRLCQPSRVGNAGYWTSFRSDFAA